jgi:hypothetical protein
MCIVTRQVRPVDDLLRFVAAPDGTVVADLKHNLPGRGVWVSASADTVAEAARRRLFQRGFRDPVSAPPGLADEVAEQLRRAALAGLAMARKAGALVAGFVKVEAALKRGQVLAVLHAADAGADGIRKLRGAARTTEVVDREPTDIRLFTSAQLGLAFGGPPVVHAALLAGSAGENALDRIGALLRFVGTGSATTPDPTPPASRSDASDRQDS